ncbi:MAG: polysaccharide biosynthesis C-terminal domain-containing protein, partial [Candidatus Rokubacteria bacterium]|nr:polysaccharide biosynthesis C-terminal domain-containing protein [Candidatus Rokubacteria bacterium]
RTLQVLSGLCALRSVEQLSAAIGSAIGRPAVAVHAAWLKLAIVAAAILPATKSFGIEGAAAAVVVASAVATGILLMRVVRLVEATPGQCAALLAVPAIMSLAPILIAPAIRQAAPGMPASVRLVLIASAGAAAYGVGTLALDRLRGAPLLQLIHGIARALRAGGAPGSSQAGERSR